jgi:hypothetical protein
MKLTSIPASADHAWIASWERAGPDALEQDLIHNDGKSLCACIGQVRRLAWRWLRTERAAALRKAYAGTPIE